MLSTLDVNQIWKILAISALVNLPFAILNLYYSQNLISCTREWFIFPKFMMATWMLIDAVVKFIMLGLLLFIALLSKFRYADGQKMFRHYLKLALVYCAFEIIWMIIGAFSFFSTIQPRCNGSLSIYTTILIIVSIVFAGYAGYNIHRQSIF